ncbi:hypothetical protein ACFQV2_13760 [Actinokineospora soli]|uniref:Ig-like domain (Group 3) n=1 Tax=Actinokineospora soli TaxID=1048753 RepID=A0ABW2TMQ1_9PSEU
MRPVLMKAARGVVALAVAAAGVVVSAGAAEAEQRPSNAALEPAKWATTDSRRPNETITTGDAVVGAWVDDRGKEHVSKSYFSFDLARFAGKRIVGAAIVGVETHVNDCDKPRSTELWVTKQVGTWTWAEQPREKAKIPGGVGLGCQWDYVEWDAAEAVRQAVAGGQLTVAMRITEQHQDDPAYGRRYSNRLKLFVQYNSAPNTPTGLAVSGKQCGGEPVWVAKSWEGTRLSALTSDPDESAGTPDIRFAWWPQDAPERRTEVVAPLRSGSFGSIHLPDTLTDGGTYAFAARSEDGMDVSAWSETCLFTTDFTRPGKPAVSSEDFPTDIDPAKSFQGVPGEFTFTAAGNADVVAYRWGEGFAQGTVAAESIGGPATVTFTPGDYGYTRIVVNAVDRAGNHSDYTYYDFYVHETAPAVWTERDPEVGFPVDVHLRARQAGAVTFTYTVDGGPERTAPVDPAAPTTISLPAVSLRGPEVKAWTTDAEGGRSAVTTTRIRVNGVSPEIEVAPHPQVAGLPVELSVRATQTGAAGVTYWLDDGPRTTVPLAADGTLRTTFTTDQTGWLTVYATTTSAAGVVSAPAETSSSPTAARRPSPAPTTRTGRRRAAPAWQARSPSPRPAPASPGSGTPWRTARSRRSPRSTARRRCGSPR